MLVRRQSKISLNGFETPSVDRPFQRFCSIGGFCDLQGSLKGVSTSTASKRSQMFFNIAFINIPKYKTHLEWSTPEKGQTMPELKLEHILHTYSNYLYNILFCYVQLSWDSTRPLRLVKSFYRLGDLCLNCGHSFDMFWPRLWPGMIPVRPIISRTNCLQNLWFIFLWNILIVTQSRSGKKNNSRKVILWWPFYFNQAAAIENPLLGAVTNYAFVKWTWPCIRPFIMGVITHRGQSRSDITLGYPR